MHNGLFVCMDKNAKAHFQIVKRPFSSSKKDGRFRQTSSYKNKVAQNKRNISAFLPGRLEGPEKLLVEGKNKL